jgi:hypothetical protein
MAREPTYQNEGDVKKQVKRLLDKHNWFWFMPPANGYGRTGIADILAIRGGVFLAIETKFGKNKPTPMQIGFLQSIMAEQGYGFVVCDRRVAWLQSWLEAFDKATDASSKKQAIPSEDGAMLLNAIIEMTAEINDPPKPKSRSA